MSPKLGTTRAQLRVGLTGSGEQGEALRGMDRTAAGEPEGVDPRGYGEVEAYPREHVTVGDVETFVVPSHFAPSIRSRAPS